MNIPSIIKCFGNIGIIVDNLDENSALIEYLDNSITFMTFILEVEQAYDIEIPDVYLRPDRLTTADDLIKMIESLVSQ